MDEREDLEIRSFIDMEVERTVNEFLAQKPCPSPVTIADYFGVYDLVRRDERFHTTHIHIPELKAALAGQTFVEVKRTGRVPKVPEVFEYFDRVLVPPGKGEIKTGSGAGMEEKEVIPRTQYLMSFLAANGIRYDKPISG